MTLVYATIVRTSVPMDPHNFNFIRYSYLSRGQIRLLLKDDVLLHLKTSNLLCILSTKAPNNLNAPATFYSLFCVPLFQDC
jgi:hypothetical protein